MAKIKAIVFDLDNTLIDFWVFKRKCTDAALNAMLRAGLKIKRERALKIINNIYDEKGMEYGEIFQEFLKRTAGKIDYRILAHALNAYRKARASLLVPYAGVRQTLKKLKERGYKIAIISDAPRLKAWLRLTAIGIDDLFDIIVTFDDTKERKPNKKPFKLILEKLRIKPEQVLMVGDSITRDMKGAKPLGMKTCLALYGRTLKPKTKPKHADFMIKKPNDLLKIVEKIKRD